MVSAAASSCRCNQSSIDASTAASSVIYTVPLAALLICTAVPDIVKEVVTVLNNTAFEMQTMHVKRHPIAGPATFNLGLKLAKVECP